MCLALGYIFLSQGASGDELPDALPAGWAQVKSRTHEGEFSYMNVYTKEHIQPVEVLRNT